MNFSAQDIRRQPLSLSRVAQVLLLAGGLASALSTAGESPGKSSDTLRLETLLAEITEAQRGRRTLRAELFQRQESELLSDAEEARGRFFYRAPDQARFELEGSEPTVLLLRGDTLLTWYPEQQRAERQTGGRQVGRLMQMLAGGGIADLSRRFSTRAVFPADPEAPWRLLFEPRSRRLARHLEEVEIWIDRQLYAPIYVRIQQASGSTEIRLSNLEPDVELAADIFELDLPAGTEVVELGSGGG